VDHLSALPRYVLPGHFQIVCDDKSGYDHVFVSDASKTFFGFEWAGCFFFTSNTIPFGWKLSAFIYHSIGLLASHFFRSIGIPCSLYIDDRHNGQLCLASQDSGLPGAYSSLPTQQDRNIALASSAIFLVCFYLSRLGYCIGLAKSTLTPSMQVPYLGFMCDSSRQSFCLLPEKNKKFLALLNEVLSRDTVSTLSLQRLAGKCNSLALAVPGVRLFTNEMNLAISRGSRSKKPSRLSGALLQEVQHWRFLENWPGVLPWREEKHVQVLLASDASLYAWGGVRFAPGAISPSRSRTFAHPP